MYWGWREWSHKGRKVVFLSLDFLRLGNYWKKNGRNAHCKLNARKMNTERGKRTEMPREHEARVRTKKKRIHMNKWKQPTGMVYSLHGKRAHPTVTHSTHTLSRPSPRTNIIAFKIKIYYDMKLLIVMSLFGDVVVVAAAADSIAICAVDSIMCFGSKSLHTLITLMICAICTEQKSTK